MERVLGVYANSPVARSAKGCAEISSGFDLL